MGNWAHPFMAAVTGDGALAKAVAPMGAAFENGLNRPNGPAICCMRRSCRSFSVSANFTTRLLLAPCNGSGRRWWWWELREDGVNM